MLRLRPDTASLLRAYIHGERKEYDQEHRDLLQLAETDPLFLAEEGCAYGYKAFVPHWETMCQAAGISLPLHGLRHWFVILRLRQIEERTRDPGEQQRYKAALIKYMGWQSPKTLRVYELEYHRIDLSKSLTSSMKNSLPTVRFSLTNSGQRSKEERS